MSVYIYAYINRHACTSISNLQYVYITFLFACHQTLCRDTIPAQKTRASNEQQNPVARYAVQPKSFHTPVQVKQAVRKEYCQEAGEIYTEVDI